MISALLTAAAKGFTLRTVKGKLLAGVAVLFALELAGLIWLGGQVGVLTVVYGILVTGFVGMSMMRKQARALKGHYDNLMVGGMTPEKIAAINGAGSEVTDSFLAMFGGVLLLIPGPLSDLVGLVLLIPPVRRGISGKTQAMLKSLAEKGALGDPSSFGAFANLGVPPGQAAPRTPFNNPGFSPFNAGSTGSSKSQGGAAVIDTTVVEDSK